MFLEFRNVVFKVSVVFYLMHTIASHAAYLDSVHWHKTDKDWVSHGEGFRANIIVWNG